jgi:hypothetical protein
MIRSVRSELVKAFPVRSAYALILADAAAGMLIAAGLPPKGAESVTAIPGELLVVASSVPARPACGPAKQVDSGTRPRRP